MELVLGAALALVYAALTLFSGFGLGTALLPAFLVWCSPSVAVAAVAVVHLADNLFRVAQMRRDVDIPVFLRFAVPAMLAAFVGAAALARLGAAPPLGVWAAGGATFEVTPVGLAVGLVLVGCAALELWPGFEAWSVDRRWLPLDGVVSGLFGGLSGQQGALRSASLVRAGLSAPAFVATGVASSVAVDRARIAVYGASFADGDVRAELAQRWPLVVVATLAASVGSFVGARLVRKVTLGAVCRVVGGPLLGLGVAVVCGLV